MWPCRIFFLRCLPIDSHTRFGTFGKRLFVFSFFGCRSYFLHIWCRLYFLSVFAHQSIFYGSIKFFFVGNVLRTFCDVRGHPSRIRPKSRRSLARKQSSRALEHTSASGGIARSARCTAQAARGEHVRRVLLPARARRQRGWRLAARHKKMGCTHAAQRRRARDAGLLMMRVRRGQNRRISPRVGCRVVW